MHILKEQFPRFATVGVINTLIDFGVLNLLLLVFDIYSGLLLLACNAGSFGCANLNSYFMNKYWTYGTSNNASAVEYGSFLLVSVVGLGLNSLFLWLLVDIPRPFGVEGELVWVNLAKMVASVGTLIWNFFAYRTIVFVVRRDASIEEK